MRTARRHVRLVSRGHTPADFPSQVTRPHGGVALAASRSRSNEPPRQIEDGAHKLLRAAASCACLELARARRRHLKPARPQRCQSIARAACSTLGWLLSLLNWTKVPHALSGHPICWSRSNGRSLAGGVQARLRQCIYSCQSAVCCAVFATQVNS